MKIHRRSWHYQLYRYARNIERGPKYLNPFASGRTEYNVPASLCPYAWSVFLGCVGAVVCAAAFLGAVVVAGPFYLAYLAFGVGLVFIQKHLPQPTLRLPHRERRERPPREHRPSIVVAFMKSRKQKVCPMIELVD